MPKLIPLQILKDMMLQQKQLFLPALLSTAL